MLRQFLVRYLMVLMFTPVLAIVLKWARLEDVTLIALWFLIALLLTIVLGGKLSTLDGDPR